MTLTAGTRLGPYEITSPIGAGGMGEVYRARDTRLDRSVAIKILPLGVGADPDRRARFEREAKTIAGLSHPHICTLHDVGDHDGAMFLVMEHLQGETLAARLAKGPLPLEQALTVATEIADALAAAHRQGIIHRDLKPGNVMLTKAGAKLLDFGLAKLKPSSAALASVTMSAIPTEEPATGAGIILGTIPYMAPEQIEGKETDARSDLFAFGAVLYEMLAGKRAFDGGSHASIIAAILERQPVPLSSLRPLTPPTLDRLVRKCLAKDRDVRWQSAADLADDLRWIRDTGDVGALARARPRHRLSVPSAFLLPSIVAAAMIGAAVMWLLRPTAVRPPVARLTLEVRPAQEMNAGVVAVSRRSLTPGGSRTALTWTPDGQTVVFVGRRDGAQQIYVRRLDAAEARPLTNTEGAQVPAVSPDGQWVAFWASKTIRKVPLGGGPFMELASGIDGPPWGLVWDAGGQLYFGQSDRIWQIPVQGAPRPVTTVGDAEVMHSLPWLLPGDRTLLYTVRKRDASWGDEEIVAQTLATGERKRLLVDAADGRYVATGHLVFLRRGVLYAVPFDAERLRVLGKEVPVLEMVAQALTAGHRWDITGAGQFAVAPTGTLAWVPGPVVPYPDKALVTVDRAGHVTPLPTPARSYGPLVRLSSDGRRLATTIADLNEVGLWVVNLNRETLTPLNRDGEANWFLWSPDRQRIVFSWLKDGRRSLASQLVDGSASPAVLVNGALYPSSFAPDGHLAAVRGKDLVMVTTDNPASVQPLIETRDTEEWPELSPDGRWLAYGANASGRFEVYVQPYPGPGRAEPISVEGGESPAWCPNGREMFFLSPTDATGKRWMMAAEFSPGPPPRIGRPQPLFPFDPRELTLACGMVRCYDVAPDGQHFYATQQLTPPLRPPVTQISLIQNWFEDLKAKVPARR